MRVVMPLGPSVLLLLLFAAQLPSGNGSRISGHVTEAASGAPISGARVTLMMVVDGPGGTFGRRPRQSTTDANGSFVFDGLESGQYDLRIEKAGFAAYPDVFGDAPIERLTVDASSKDPQLRIALHKGAVVAGRVVNSSGEPDADLQVSALRRTDKAGAVGFVEFVLVGSAQTNHLGEFRIASLPSGEYRIVAAAQRHGPFDAIRTGASSTLAPTFFPGTPDQNAARSVILAPGQTVAGIEFAMITVSAFRVSGVVVDRGGHPSPQAMVMLIPDVRSSGSFTPMMAIAADDGTFEIGQVIPGTYRLDATAGEGGLGAAGAGGFFATFSDDAPSGPGTITVGSADMTGLKVVASRR
jgi:hypothetical protein